MGIVIRQSLKGTIVNYVGVLLGIFVQFYVVTRYLDPEVMGLSKVVYEVAFLLSTLALLGSGSTGMRFFPYFRDPKTGNHGFLFYYALMPLAGVALMAAVYVSLRGPIEAYFGAKSPLFNQHFYYVLPMMVVLAFWVWAENYANIHMRIAVPKAVREVGMRLLMLVAYLAYGYWHVLDVTGLIVAFTVCYALCMFTTGAYALHVGDRTLRHDWRFITPDLRGRILRYSGFLMLSTISGNLISQMDLFMLSGVKGLYSAGVYTIVVYMVEIVNMPSRNITPISSPLAAQAMKDGDTKQATMLYRQVSIHQMLASALLLLLVWVNLDNIFAIIPNGERFVEGRWAVLLLGLSKVIFGTLNFGNTLISFSRYYYWTLVVTMVLMFLSIGTNLYFIPVLGLTGAALASLITTVLSYSYQQYLVQCKLHTNPFTWRHLRVALLVTACLLVNGVLPSLTDVSPWLDGAVRTLTLLVVAVVLASRMHISEQIDRFLRRNS